MHPIGYAVLGVISIWAILKGKSVLDAVPRVGDVATVFLSNLTVQGFPPGLTANNPLGIGTGVANPQIQVRITTIPVTENGVYTAAASNSVTPAVNLPVTFTRRSIVSLSRTGKQITL